jgi:hypothetical protein
MTEEAQQSQEVPENTVKEPENPETIVEYAENALDNSVKKRGRPAGSKDKAPRKKKIVVVEEDVSEPSPPALPQALPPALPELSPEPPALTQAKPPKTKPKAKMPKPAALPQPEPEPLSPGTVMREASHHILKLKSISAQARRDHIFQTYTAKLHAI